MFKTLTTSWDDGHILDVKLAGLLKKYGIKGTFYIAPNDHEFEKNDRLKESDIKLLANDFEIGAHTMTHPLLTKIDSRQAKEEIETSKRYLERLIKRPINSFCYPAGKYDQTHVKIVKDAGFKLARTVRRYKRRGNNFEIATTVHAYRHWSDVWHIAKVAHFIPLRFMNYLLNWDELAIAIFDEGNGPVFHLWGHSWEIEKNHDWVRLERVLRHISKTEIKLGDNYQAYIATKPKLLLSAPYFPPATGGLERYAKTMALASRDAGYDVVIITSGNNKQITETIEDGLYVYRLPLQTTIMSNTPFSLKWPKMIKEIMARENPDLINAHMPVPYLSELVIKAAGKTPVIVTYHSASLKKGKPILDTLISIYERLILSRSFDRANRIVCSSDFIRSGFLKKYAYKSVTITPGVDTLLFRPTSAESKRNQILFIGDFSHDQKGLIYLRKAIEAIPAVTLRIVGKGDQFHASRTSYAGELTATQLVKEIQLSSVLVLPTVNKSESFGMVLIEAMACGVPVIASNIGGVPAVVEHNKSGLLVPPADVMSLTAAINQIINNKHLSKVLAENGLKQVRKSYAWSTKTAQFIGLCKTVELPSIVQITPYYPPHLGGMENVVQELSANLASQGFPTRVVTSDIGKSSSLYCDNEIFVDRLGGNEIAGLPILWKLFPRLLFMKNVDVFHVHIAQAGVPEVTLFTAWLRKKAIVMHFHLDVEPSGRFGFLFVMYKKILLGATLRHTNKLIAFSREQSEFLQTRYKVSSGRIDIVPNGISALFFSQNNKRENDLNPDTLQLLYVGRLATQKRVDRLVDAMPMVKPKTHLTIVGDGTQRIKLEERAKKLELDNVTFVGRMPLDAVKKYHLVSDVFVLPSDREGMPLVLLEAMASGLPVIGSNVVGIRELVDNVGVLVDKPSPQTFAAALNKMLIDQKLLADMSERSRNAASKLRWPAVTKQVGEIYKGLLS